MADTGTGATVTFGTTSALNALEIISINGDGFSREVIDVTNLSTTGSRRKMPGDTY